MGIKIHQLAQTGHRTQMMSFVIETENRHIIVIDGGMRQDAEYLHGYLQGLCGVKPVIDLWILTHCHCDHTDAFYEIMHHFKNDFEIKQLMYNFPSQEFAAEFDPWGSDKTIAELEDLITEIKECGTDIIIPKIGDVYEIDGVTFEILYTPETPRPEFTENFTNNSSTVIRMEACGQSVLFLGDLGIEAGNKMMYTCPPENISSDFVQMAHHGQNGVTRGFYSMVSPKACLWCTPLWLWNNDAGNGYNTHSWQTIIVRGWMEEMGVRHHFVSKDGIHIIELPYQF